MAPRDDGKSGGNGADEIKAEKGIATLATLRYVSIFIQEIEILIDCLQNRHKGYGAEGEVCSISMN